MFLVLKNVTTQKKLFFGMYDLFSYHLPYSYRFIHCVYLQSHAKLQCDN